MSEEQRYKVLYSLSKPIYKDGAPVVIEAGALVQDTIKNKLHVQIKFLNIGVKQITMLKAKIWLLDSIGRALSDSEKQYLDLTANPYENFAGNTPIYLKENTARQFKACATEICFSDGSVWEGGENGWEEIPAQKAITEKMRSTEALMEFKAVYCKDAQYLPVAYMDLWFCACGGANKSERKTCWRCHADFQAMEEADEFTLKNNHLYKKGIGLVGAKTSQEIAKGIEILSGIEDWKDSKSKLEESTKSCASRLSRAREWMT